MPNIIDENLLTILNQAITARAFPGSTLWLAHDEDILADGAQGTTAYNDEISRPVTPETIYDIASLSKTLTMAAYLIAAHETKTDVDTTLARFFPVFNTEEKRGITLRRLLNHTSGISIAIQSFTEHPTIKENVTNEHEGGPVPVEGWVDAIAKAPLKTEPGTSVLYSCTNYFLLARVVEQLSGQRLDRFIEERLLQPLDMQRSTFTPLDRFPHEVIAPTEIKPGTEKPYWGVVHDEAARTWQQETGGACGNAGVFSTARDLSRFTGLWLDDGVYNDQQILPAALVHEALTNTVREDRETDRAWCWQINAPSYMSFVAPCGSAGHSGFTGPTMLLHQPTRHVAIVLENRVYPTRKGPYRMPFHRRIAQWMFEKTGHARKKDS